MSVEADFCVADCMKVIYKGSQGQRVVILSDNLGAISISFPSFLLLRGMNFALAAYF
jgi:hypothetical protein